MGNIFKINFGLRLNTPQAGSVGFIKFRPAQICNNARSASKEIPSIYGTIQFIAVKMAVSWVIDVVC